MPQGTKWPTAQPATRVWPDDDDDLEYGGGSSSSDAYDSFEDRASVRVLAKVLPGFYAAYYGLAAVCSAALGTPFNGLEPFDHVEFSPAVEGGANGWRSLATWLAMVLTFTVAGPWLVYFGTRDSARANNCATAVATLHFFLTTVATQRLPENWVWWATIMPCWLFMGRAAEFVLAHYGFRLRWDAAQR